VQRILLASVIALASCGGDSSAAANQMTRDELTEVCDGIAFNWEACDLCSSHTSCVAECINYLDHRRADGIREAAPCLETLGCFEFFSVCWEDVEPLGVHHDWSDACFSRSDCGLDADDCDVERIRTYAANVTEREIPCFDGACADIQDCIDDVLADTAL
jgi:hypothetical protein